MSVSVSLPLEPISVIMIDQNDIHVTAFQGYKEIFSLTKINQGRDPKVENVTKKHGPNYSTVVILVEVLFNFVIVFNLEVVLISILSSRCKLFYVVFFFNKCESDTEKRARMCVHRISPKNF